MTPAIKHIQVEGSVHTCITDINVSRCCYFKKEFKYTRSHTQSLSPPPLKCNMSLPKQMRDPHLQTGWSIPQLFQSLGQSSRLPPPKTHTLRTRTRYVALIIYRLGGKLQCTLVVGLERHVRLAQKLFPHSWSHLIHPPSDS